MGPEHSGVQHTHAGRLAEITTIATEFLLPEKLARFSVSASDSALPLAEASRFGLLVAQVAKQRLLCTYGT